MKNETARREIESLDYYLQNHTDDYSEESHTAMMMAVKALDQEPCDDAISRQAVQDYIAKYLSQYLYNDVREAVEVIDEYIGELPSVNPTKTGHWEQYGNSWEDKVKCSECGKEQPKILCGEQIIGHWSDYCPNCGVRMFELQESEDKEWQ